MQKKIFVVEVEKNELYNIAPQERPVASFNSKEEAQDFIDNRATEYVQQMIEPRKHEWTVEGFRTNVFHAFNHETGHDFTLMAKA